MWFLERLRILSPVRELRKSFGTVVKPFLDMDNSVMLPICSATSGSTTIWLLSRNSFCKLGKLLLLRLSGKTSSRLYSSRRTSRCRRVLGGGRKVLMELDETSMTRRWPQENTANGNWIRRLWQAFNVQRFGSSCRNYNKTVEHSPVHTLQHTQVHLLPPATSQQQANQTYSTLIMTCFSPFAPAVGINRHSNTHTCHTHTGTPTPATPTHCFPYMANQQPALTRGYLKEVLVEGV